MDAPLNYRNSPRRTRSKIAQVVPRALMAWMQRQHAGKQSVERVAI
jgi:hypothetical protein